MLVNGPNRRVNATNHALHGLVVQVADCKLRNIVTNYDYI